MKFSEYSYKRPNIEATKTQFAKLLEQFEASQSVEEQCQLIEQINQLRTEFESMYTISSIRHSINTKDRFYEEENNYFDDRYPELSEYTNQYYKALANSKFRPQLAEKFGEQLFTIAELTVKTFEPVILQDLKAENKLDTAYRKIKAQAQIELDGKTFNLSSIRPMEVHRDRTIRKQAADKKWGFFAEKATEIEGIYDELVKLRHGMAQKLGYKNYIELGYARMLRSDYDAEAVKHFRQQVLEHVVPYTQELYKRQAKRLGLKKLNYYDEDFRFPSGNPTPKGDGAWMEKQAKKMYAELSKETDEFFSFMQERDLMDLVAKDGKETGGYCTLIGQYKSPFIFSNFNGTSHDVTVLTHEAGHAFQCYSTCNSTDVYEYRWPTYEACEIHSMSMEFLTWSWMNLFFKEDTEKFKFSHLSGALLFLPYGVAVDEFQHEVYSKPEMTPAERNATWRKIEKKYLPHIDYTGNEFLENGGFWQRQTHIFSMPFYYIDYVLAQICAFQFWQRDMNPNEKEAAWKDYLTLCNAGGTKSFLDLVKLGNLDSPFVDGTIKKVMQPIKDYLDNIDDSSF